MKIYNSYSINFTAKKNITKSFTDKNLTQKVKTPVENMAKIEFYNDIEKFMKKDLSKEQYLKNFIGKMNKELYSQLDNTEKKYVYDMLTTIDLTNNKNITEAYLLEKMKSLTEFKK